jgi:hypothetical protein
MYVAGTTVGKVVVNTLTHEAKLFLRHRDECMDIARAAPNETQRIMLLHIAGTWQRLADSVGKEQAAPTTSH